MATRSTARSAYWGMGTLPVFGEVPSQPSERLCRPCASAEAQACIARRACSRGGWPLRPVTSRGPGRCSSRRSPGCGGSWRGSRSRAGRCRGPSASRSATSADRLAITCSGLPWWVRTEHPEAVRRPARRVEPRRVPGDVLGEQVVVLGVTLGRTMRPATTRGVRPEDVETRPCRRGSGRAASPRTDRPSSSLFRRRDQQVHPLRGRRGSPWPSSPARTRPGPRGPGCAAGTISSVPGGAIGKPVSGATATGSPASACAQPCDAVLGLVVERALRGAVDAVEDLRRRLDPARDAELQPPARQQVDGRRVLRDRDGVRVPHGQHGRCRTGCDPWPARSPRTAGTATTGTAPGAARAPSRCRSPAPPRYRNRSIASLQRLRRRRPGRRRGRTSGS